MGNILILGDLVAASRDVGEALEMLTLHQQINSDGGLAFMMQRGGMVDVGYAIYHPGLQGAAQIYDAVLAFATNMMRELCGPGWAPTEAFLPHANPPGFAPYRSVFKTAVRFDAETCALRFPKSWLLHRLTGFDPDRMRALRARCQRMPMPQRPLVESVYRALRLVMLQGGTRGDEVAQVLSMHRRTLNRRLPVDGFTLQQILDNLRFTVARDLLGTSDLSLDDVAATLGYAGASPFMRAFHRWTGHSPGAWRRAAQSAQRFGATTPRRAHGRLLNELGALNINAPERGRYTPR
jgi:AraC-like DNA-binding protein